MAGSPSADVVVIGAGCAGLSAAVRLSARGRRVIVLEEAPRLGGRAASFSDPVSGERLDNGQHALFGCYRETYGFLREIGTDDLAPLDSTLRLVMADASGRSSALVCPSWRAPFHLMGGLMGWSAIAVADRLAAGRLGGFLWSARRDGAAAAASRVPADLTASQWLRQHGQPQSLCDWLWFPLALAALNQDPNVASAQPFARVIAELFGAAAAAASLGVPAVPLDALYAEPAARFIESRGGTVVRRQSARVEFGAGGGPLRVRVGTELLQPRAVISAVPWHAFSRLWAGEVPLPLKAISDSADRLESAPIVTVNLWFDRPVMAERQMGLVGTQFHWVFRKANELGGDFLAGSGRNHLRGHLPQTLVTLVASGAEALLRRDNAHLAELAERELRACLPGTAGAVCERALVVREARATFSLAPGSPARPGVLTPVPGFFLAGDWTDTGLPGTIEGAVLSGHRAAEAAMIVL